MTTLTRYAGVKATGIGPKLKTLSNLVSNPRAALGTSMFAGTAGTGGTVSLSSVATGGPLPESPSFVRMAWSKAPTSVSNAQLFFGSASDPLPISPGKEYVYKVYARSNAALTVAPLIGFYSGTAFSSSPAGTAVTLQPNEWTALTVVGTPSAGADRAQLNVNPRTASILPAVDTTLEISALMFCEVTPGAQTAQYGDGDMPGWVWTGARHLSPSRGYGSIVP